MRRIPELENNPYIIVALMVNNRDEAQEALRHCHTLEEAYVEKVCYVTVPPYDGVASFPGMIILSFLVVDGMQFWDAVKEVDTWGARRECGRSLDTTPEQMKWLWYRP